MPERATVPHRRAKSAEAIVPGALPREGPNSEESGMRMRHGKARHQMPGQLGLALDPAGGEAPGGPRSGEAGRATQREDRSACGVIRAGRVSTT
jgi:hypothetical protein